MRSTCAFAFVQVPDSDLCSARLKPLRFDCSENKDANSLTLEGVWRRPDESTSRFTKFFKGLQQIEHPPRAVGVRLVVSLFGSV